MSQDETEAEFPSFPEAYNGFTVNPIDLIQVKGGALSTNLALINQGTNPVLFKVKCTNNRRIRIENCAGILQPGEQVKVLLKRLDDFGKYKKKKNDSLIVHYAILGTQWARLNPDAFRCWRRVKDQQVSTRAFKLVMIEEEREQSKLNQ